MTVLAGLAFLAPLVFALQDPGAEKNSPLTIESVVVDPAQPGPDTLCKLSVRLRNKGSRTASRLTFDVKLNGEPLSVYSNHMFVINIPPGKETELKLYNFWTSDSGRPYPKDRRLELEVRLTGARWLDDEMNPAAAVEPLPPPRSLALSGRSGSGS